MIKRLRVTVDGNSYDVTVEVPEEVTSAAPAAPVISAPQPTHAAPAAPAQKAPAHGHAPAQTNAPAHSAPKPAAAGPGDVPCPLSGRITGVMVQLGQDVNEGDHLVTIEAMKMNTFVFAPRGGKVIAIKTEVGAVAEEGQVLVTLG
jgi:biotin carboxyl carrier protein